MKAKKTIRYARLYQSGDKLTLEFWISDVRALRVTVKNRPQAISAVKESGIEQQLEDETS